MEFWGTCIQYLHKESKLELIWEYDQINTNWQELSNLYKIAPLGEKHAGDLQITFSNSMFKCFVYDDSRLVGVGRALADGVDTSYLCDIAVHPGYQGKGIGKSIVKKLLNLSKNHRKIILYANPGKEPFYRKLGFMKMNTAMAIFQDQDFALESGLVRESPQ
jgi:ribosomal protein S18 acetylase RimI-like enzyme